MKTIEDIELEAAWGLLQHSDSPLHPLACENVLDAIHTGIIQLSSPEQERMVIDLSIKAGRGALEGIGVQMHHFNAAEQLRELGIVVDPTDRRTPDEILRHLQVFVTESFLVNDTAPEAQTAV